MDTRPIGFFDSGVGGLCICQAVRTLLPNEKTIYLGDGDYCPYGNRAPEEICARAIFLTETLLRFQCKLIVVACNTATAAAIDTLRMRWPHIPFVGMEPAIKPAALHSHSGVVGVLATMGTFQGRLYRETCAHFAQRVEVLTCVADEFVSLVEKGDTSSAHAEEIVRAKIEPLLLAGADHLVLGCTHFPHLKTLIQKVAGTRAVVVDPAPAVALQVKRLLARMG